MLKIFSQERVYRDRDSITAPTEVLLDFWEQNMTRITSAFSKSNAEECYLAQGVKNTVQMGAAGKHLSSDRDHLCYGFVVNRGSGLMAGLNYLRGLFQLQGFCDQSEL